MILKELRQRMQKRKLNKTKFSLKKKYRILTLTFLLHVYVKDLLSISQIKTRNYKQIRKMSNIDEVSNSRTENLLANPLTNFRYYHGIFIKWWSSTFCHVIYTVNHVWVSNSFFAKIPWMPKTFHAGFPVLVKFLPSSLYSDLRAKADVCPVVASLHPKRRLRSQAI